MSRSPSSRRCPCTIARRTSQRSGRTRTECTRTRRTQARSWRDEVTSFVDRSSPEPDEQRADGPDSVTTFAVRPSYVAQGELHHEYDSYASSENRAARGVGGAPLVRDIGDSGISEVDEAGAAEPFDFAPPIPSASFQSGPVDYEALSRYLFDDVPHPAAQHLPSPPPPAGYADVLAPEAPPASYPRQPEGCVRQPMPSRPPTDETPCSRSCS